MINEKENRIQLIKGEKKKKQNKQENKEWQK